MEILILLMRTGYLTCLVFIPRYATWKFVDWCLVKSPPQPLALDSWGARAQQEVCKGLWLRRSPGSASWSQGSISPLPLLRRVRSLTWLQASDHFSRSWFMMQYMNWPSGINRIHYFSDSQLCHHFMDTLNTSRTWLCTMLILNTWTKTFFSQTQEL